ncbi:nitroreductase [Methanosarcina sp. 2.H.T.1A.6]|uniref:SagB/ThcOx family dehydrogenase n=1 Tax=unclassified Methanosarcina TaxID=2644672 RepID=UPI0006229C90|nr:MULTISPECIES: SagB/ThcOx family dehydrogenase [unclassified Methanosarcina]KKG16869.1 nitroreductase [Methanosarcina sp. 2.H.T.1A.3]KKG22489.1 nitroreductase [Methanosarcina sp. 2.H.T.1A.6]KKG23489.1 nitroreductase [Methanosarcina sp. 2.H.T.1A.15]
MGNQGLTDLPMKIKLPEPDAAGKSHIEELIAKRRSLREYADRELSEPLISRFLWATQGISSKGVLRTVPSAGALYPLEVHIVIGEGNGLEAGIYRYIAEEHSLIQEIPGDMRTKLSEAALSESMIKNAPVSLVISAVYPRITSKYGKRGLRYAHMEAGHAAQNVYLLGVELGIGTCAVGAFADEEIKKVLKMPANEDPLYILPLGYI